MRAAALVAVCLLAAPALAQRPSPDWPSLRRGWRASVARIKASGRLPLIDLLSTYREVSLNPEEFQREMDREGVALAVFSPDLEAHHLMDGVYVDWEGAARRLAAAGPRRFIPAPTGDLDVVARDGDDADGFLDALLARALREGYPLLGQFRFRSYPSNQQWINVPFGRAEADVTVPIDGRLGRKLFEFSQRHGVPFLIRYEPEDRLLPALEAMLDAYPGAKVVWRAAGRVARAGLSQRYGPDYARRLLEAHPNLYFDLSQSGLDDVSLESGAPTSTLWDRRFGGLDERWARLIGDHPWRFLVALGLDHDHITQVGAQAQERRRLLLQLPPAAREIVAYKAAWKLLFGEELP